MSYRTNRIAFPVLVFLASVAAACGGKASGTPQNGDAGSSSGGSGSGGTSSGGSGSGGASSSGSSSGGSSSSGSGSGSTSGSSSGSTPPVVHTDKVDLLFMIDNSASMGDKQALLAKAVPDLVTRLVSPNCVDTSGKPTGQTAAPDGSCATGTAEFPPVHDLHIGVVTSSLGGRGGDICPSSGTGSTNPANPSLSAHNDDRGELIDRGGDPSDPTVETTVADATSPDDFLSWFPAVPPNAGKPAPPTTPVTTTMQLIGDFTAIVSGVHEHGCGFEAQNEAWYRFLVQPDPFDSITKSSATTQAQLTGIDATILKQRADFLRPDSLVAVVVVTDENEEVADPLSVGGQGWLFENSTFPGGPGPAPEGTIECKQPVDPNNPTTTGPFGPNCTSCAFANVKSDPNFATRCPNDGASGTNGFLDPADDQINVRFFHQKERFGLFAGYPVTRYVRGLTAGSVPDVAHEHDNGGNYVGDQDAQANCVNPLYAQNLPTSASQETCQLTRGPRSPSQVFYVAIAGVPHELLQAKPGDPECPPGTNEADCPQKSQLTPGDWTLITGADPEHYDFTGADFHMVESIDPRTTNTGHWANVSTCSATSPNDCDPINGREWNTNKGDLQLACRFDLRPQYGGVGKDCTSAKYTGACDCAAGNPLLNSVLCDPQTPTLQIYGKAYPGVREMLIARSMAQVNGQAGGQGIVSSLCPIHVSEAAPGDPLYGYRPAVSAIVARFRSALL